MAEKSIQSDTAPKTVMAHARSLRIAPRKLRLVANLVRKMRAQDALTQLAFVNKKGAPIVVKLLQSAISNAEHNFSLPAEGLYIKSITCDQAQVLKRYMPRARGSASPLNRRMSHLHVVLESRAVPKQQGRFAKLVRARKVEKEVKPVEQNTEIVETAKGIPQATKSNEQMKQSKVQQKRRLFNRKSGE